jgi:hypothetical protein
MSLIECSCIVNGHKEAQELVIDLNAMKSSCSEDFYIQYDRNQDYSQNDNYVIVGNVTQGDWIMLNYMNFMKNVLQGQNSV